GCVELPPIFHDGGEGERLAAGAGADVDYLLAGFGPAGQRCELRAFVLHLDHAFDEGGLGMDGRALGVSIKRKAQTDRRPAREHGIEVREGSAGPSRSALTALTRRSSGARVASAAASAMRSSPKTRARWGSSHCG